MAESAVFASSAPVLSPVAGTLSPVAVTASGWRAGSGSSVVDTLMTCPLPCPCCGRAAAATSALAASLGTGVGLVMDRLQPLDCHVSVELRRRQRSVTELVLDATKVSSAVEHVRARGVPKSVGAD